MDRALRRSAGLVLAVGKSSELPRFLMVQRSATSKFMPGSYVFPGGLCEEADFSTDWLPLLAGSSRSRPRWLSELLQRTDAAASETLFSAAVRRSGDDCRPSPVASEVTTDRQLTVTRQPLPPALGLRITAIRETFEETGLLLAHSVADDAADSTGAVDGNDAFRKRLAAAARCRSRVQASASQFLDVCREHGLVPDLARLHSWSRWLTPAGHKSGRRYDTTFYLAAGPVSLAAEAVADSAVQHQQQSNAANIGAEVVDLKVDHAGAMLRCYLERRLLVAPPQLFDLARLGTCGSVAELEEAAREREPLGLELWAPVAVELRDGRLFVMPGDDLYPATGKDSQPLQLDLSIDEVMKQCARHIRMISRKGAQLDISVNVPLSLCQRAPPSSLSSYFGQFPASSRI